MTYLELLQNLPIDRLRGIVRRRARALATLTKCTNKLDLCTKMVKLLFVSRSITEAISETNLLQIRILVYIVTNGGIVDKEKMIADAGEPHREHIESALDDLQDLALLFESSELGNNVLVCPDSVLDKIPAPEPYKNLLSPSLGKYPTDVVEYIAKSLDIESLEGLRSKSHAVSEIAHHLLDLSRLRTVVDSLSLDANKVLEFVISNSGVTSLYELGGHLDVRYRNQLYSYDWGKRWAQGRPRNPVEELLGKGILVLLGSVGWGYGEIIIPGDVLNLLVGRDTASWLRVVEPPAIPRSPEGLTPRLYDSLPRDVAYLMGYLSRMEAVRTNKGIIHRTALKAVAKGMTEKSETYPALVYAVAREAELIDITERLERYDVTSTGLKWLEQPLSVQQLSLATIWFGQDVFAEDFKDSLATFNGYYGARTRLYRDGLIKILIDLEAANPGCFHSLRDIKAKAAFRCWDRFMDDNPNSQESEVDDKGEGTNSTEGAHNRFRQVPEEELNVAGVSQIVYRICAESLVWLGLVETAGPSAKLDTYVRLSDLGKTHFMGVPRNDTVGSTVDKFVVQPNLEIYAPPNLAAAHLYRLFKISDPSPSGMLTLTKENLRRALDKGESSESLIKFLKDHSATVLPQNVEYLISEVGGRHGHIRVGKAGIYLQVTDPMLLKELMAQKKLGIHYKEQLTETVALVTGDSVESILKLLRAAGYLPVTSRQGETHQEEPVNSKQYVLPKPYQYKNPDIENRINWKAIS